MMNKIILLAGLCFSTMLRAGSQPPSKSEMDRMIEDALKQSGMSQADMDKTKKMMNGVMPSMMDKAPSKTPYPAFTNNKQLVPQKNSAKISALPSKKFTQADVISSANLLYSKIMTNGTASEKALIKKVLTKFVKPEQIEGAALIALFQGHPETAMALSMQAVIKDPGNGNYQNNMAAMLTQYGFPERSVPVLKKLRDEFPGNSTILSNLAHAFLGLGLTDSSKNIIYLMAAGGMGRGNPEASLCGGLMEELYGDPAKATDQYAESMAEAINPFTDNIANNAGGKNKVDALDFDMIKGIITIHEYFPKDWVVLPKFSNDVANYVYENGLKKGYETMFNQLENDLTAMSAASQEKIDAVMNKSEDEMIRTFMTDGIKGHNAMSIPAVTIMKILTRYLMAWGIDYADEYNKLNATVNAKRKLMESVICKDCQCSNVKYNAFMSEVNPLIWEFHTRRNEEYRNWLNAMVTWNWYVGGNPQGLYMTQCLDYTKSFVGHFKAAFSDMVTYASCKIKSVDEEGRIAMPAVPDFTCPAQVKMPFGQDWQNLSNTSGNFNKNIYEIMKDPTALIPNVTVGFGAGKNSIAEPGKTPYVKTANGTMTENLVNYYKGPWDQLPNYADDMVLPYLVDPEQAKRNHVRSLLRKMMTTDCNDDGSSDEDKFKKELEKRMKDPKKTDEYDRLQEQLKELRKKLTENEATRQLEELITKIDQLIKDAQNINEYKEVSDYAKKAAEALEQIDQTPKDEKLDLRGNRKVIMQTISGMEASGALKQLNLYGLSPTICSGLQATGMYTIAAGLYR